MQLFTSRMLGSNSVAGHIGLSKDFLRFPQTGEATEMSCNTMEMLCELGFEEYCPLKEGYFGTLGLQKGVRFLLREVRMSAFGTLKMWSFRGEIAETVTFCTLWEVSVYGSCPQAKVRLFS